MKREEFLYHIFLFAILFAVTWVSQSKECTVFPKRLCLLSLYLSGKYQQSILSHQNLRQIMKYKNSVRISFENLPATPKTPHTSYSHEKDV